MKLFCFSISLFVWGISLLAQENKTIEELNQNNNIIDERNPLYIPTESGFVFFVAEEGKIIFAKQLTEKNEKADSMLDMQASKGVVTIETEDGNEYFEYKQVDVNELFSSNEQKGKNSVYVRRYYSPKHIRTRVASYASKSSGMVGRASSPGIEKRRLGPEQFYGRYREQDKVVDYQFSVLENKFAFYSTNSNHLVIFDQFGEVLSFTTLKPTEPFIYSKKHQSIFYDEAQQTFYLLNTTNFGYNWYHVNPSTGEAKLVHQIKKLWLNPNWYIYDGTLFYTKEVSGNTEEYQVSFSESN